MTPNTSMDESLFLDTSADQFNIEEPSLVCFTGGGAECIDNNSHQNKDADMKEAQQGEDFFRNMYIRLN